MIGRLVLCGVVGFGAWMAAGCDLPVECAGTGQPGIIVDLHTSSGGSGFVGAMIIAREARAGQPGHVDTTGPIVPRANDGTPSLTGQGFAALAWNRGGIYEVTASKPYWTSATQLVAVPATDRCGGVKTQRISMTIDVQPGAPAVRSVAVDPRWLRFGFCNSSARASALVEGDAGSAADVRWFSEDTNVVTVTSTGVVKVRSRGKTRVGARSLADPAVIGYLEARVDPVCL
jgi:hypothetical protein